MIKAIVFDYGGVLKINPQNSLEDILKYLGTNKEEWDNEWFLGNEKANNSGVSYEDYFLDVCLKFKNEDGVKNKILEMLSESNAKHIVNEELVSIVKSLKKYGYKIGLISNYSLELREKLKKDEIYDLFDSIIISAEVKLIKPDPEIFKTSFKELGVNPEEVVFIDDTPKSFENSEMIGYTPILYKDNNLLKQELKKILQIDF